MVVFLDKFQSDTELLGGQYRFDDVTLIGHCDVPVDFPVVSVGKTGTPGIIENVRTWVLDGTCSIISWGMSNFPTGTTLFSSLRLWM